MFSILITNFKHELKAIVRQFIYTYTKSACMTPIRKCFETAIYLLVARVRKQWQQLRSHSLNGWQTSVALVTVVYSVLE